MLDWKVMADGEGNESRNKPHKCHGQMHGRVGTGRVAVSLQPWTLQVTEMSSYLQVGGGTGSKCQHRQLEARVMAGALLACSD